MGIVVNDGSATTQPHRVRAKPFGDQNLPGAEGYPQIAMDRPYGGADLGLTVLYGEYGDIEIDGLSTGHALILAPDANGIPTPEDNGPWSSWMSVNVSIAHGSRGAVGEHWDRANRFFGSAGSEVMGYYFANSVGIDADLIGQTKLEATRDNVGMTRPDMGDPTAPVDDVHAMDYAFGVQQELGTVESTFFGAETHAFLFFSVSAQWCADFPTQHQGKVFAPGDPGHATPDPCTIYAMEWSNGAWSVPYVWATRQLLGFSATGGDLDGFDIDLRRYNVIFSGTLGSTIEGDPHPSQLMIIGLSNGTSSFAELGDPATDPEENGVTVDAVAKDLSDGIAPNTIDVVNKFDLDSDIDEIDSICVIDPEIGAFDRYAGIRIANHSSLFGTPMGMSMIRTDDTSFRTVDPDDPNTSEWKLQISGWGDVQTPEVAVLFIQRYSWGASLGVPVIPAGAVNLGGLNWTTLVGLPRSGSQDSVEYDYVHDYALNSSFPGTSIKHAFRAISRTRGGGIAATGASVFID